MSAQRNRLWVLDLVRGVFMVTMIISHSVFFFHANTNSFLQIAAAIGDMVSFTGLLLISGGVSYVSYIHFEHPYPSVIVRLLRRLFIYLLGYYLLAFWASGILKTGNIGEVWPILTFHTLVPFTEFIIPFIFIGFLKIPLRPAFQFLSKSLNGTILVSTLLYFGSTFLAYQDFSFFGKSLIVGEPGVYSFPVLSYLPVYLAGLYLGRRFFIHSSYHELFKFLKSTSLFLASGVALLILAPIVLNISAYDMFNRFPPAPAFLLTGLALAFFFIAVILELQELKNFPVSRTVLLLLGQNSFAILLTHTAIIYAYRFAELPRVHSPILTGLLTLFSSLFALYFAKILPFNYSLSLTFIDWCECSIRQCKHAKEHSFVKSAKRWLFAVIDIPHLFTVTIGQKRIPLIRRWNMVFAFSALLLAATPLGIAENNAYFQNAIAGSSGSVSKTWVLTTTPVELIYKVPAMDSLTVGQPDTRVEYELKGTVKNMNREGDFYVARIPTKDMAPGFYQISALFNINYAQYRTKPTDFKISAPLLVAWTIDWEGYDAPDGYLSEMETIADLYGIPMTQLYNPRNFTSPDIAPERAEFLTQWVKNRHEKKGDEIGLHLHMFPDFVEQAGVVPIRDKTWGGGWTEGYDVLTTAYSYEDMTRILMYAKEMFYEKGLPQPRSYRAGAWFANSDTLRALADTGFLVDSSGRTAYQFGTKKIDGFWDLSETAQPYFPSEKNQNSTNPPPRLSILEVPNNGADDYAFSAEEMIDRFTKNYGGDILLEPRQVTYLSHPNWFDPNRQKSMKQVFSHIYQFSNLDDRGPVVFSTLQDIYRIWQGKQND